MSLCEYNPEKKAPATLLPSEGDCKNEATVSVGAAGEWHLCDSCAALPFFKRLRKRTPLKRSRG